MYMCMYVCGLERRKKERTEKGRVRKVRPEAGRRREKDEEATATATAAANRPDRRRDIKRKEPRESIF